MELHALELLHAAIWGMGILGGLFMAMLLWSVRLFLGRMDAQDEELKKIRELLASELHLLRQEHHLLEIRVVRVESNVGITHQRHE